jgi:hypothetical protein
MPSGVSFSPENEQIDSPLLMRPAVFWLLSVGGGPVISPASAADEATSAARPIEVAIVLKRFVMTDPHF